MQLNPLNICYSFKDTSLESLDDFKNLKIEPLVQNSIPTTVDTFTVDFSKETFFLKDTTDPLIINEHIELLYEIIENSRTRLQSLKEIHALKKGRMCESCNGAHTPQALCNICHDNKGPESLNRSPTWLFDWDNAGIVSYQDGARDHAVDDRNRDSAQEASDYE